MSARTKLGLVSLLLVFIVLWFSGLGYRKLANPDEGRYAEIPREMVVSHDWVTPRLNGIKYFEKPPLQYWATATAYTLFGVSEWATRLWPALTGFLTVLVIGWAGARLFGLAAGAAAALILIGNIYFSVMGHIATLDMGLAFFMSLALVCFLRAQAASADMNPLQRDVDPPRRDADQRQRYWMMGAAAASACAVLSKGVVAIALPGLALIFYSLAQRDVSIWRRLHPIASSAVFLAIAAPWFIAVSRANPEFLRFFFIHEHLERYTTATHHREGPLWYFLPILLIGLVPWIGLLPRAVRAAWLAPRPVGTARTQGTFSNERFLVAWALAIFIFFSASHSKLPAYVLPLVPALALLVGREVARMDPRAVFWRIAVVALIAATVLFGAIQAMEYRYASKPDFVLYESYSVWIKAGLATIFIATCVLYRWRATRAVVIAGFALTTLVASQLMVLGFEKLSPLQSAWSLASKLGPYLGEGTPVFSVEMYEQTLPPYLGRTLTLVAYQDELAFGLQQEPDRWIKRIEQFEDEWRRLPRAAAIMPIETYKRLASQGLPMRIIEASGKRCIVVKPDAD